jgi:hypothetical protein
LLACWLFDPNWLLALFTAVLTAVAVLQVRLLIRQDKHFQNSERAWILAELGWSDRLGRATIVTKKENGVVKEWTYLGTKLTCRNAGRSPAWIQAISARAWVAPALGPDIKSGEDFDTIATMDAIGAGKETQLAEFVLHAAGRAQNDERLRLRVQVSYRDIFGVARKTKVEYSCGGDGSGLGRDPTSDENT